jgi:hypothetical protein
MHGVRDEERERPTPADQSAGKDTITLAALQVYSGAEDYKAEQIAKTDFFGIAE